MQESRKINKTVYICTWLLHVLASQLLQHHIPNKVLHELGSKIQINFFIHITLLRIKQKNVKMYTYLQLHHNSPTVLRHNNYDHQLRRVHILENPFVRKNLNFYFHSPPFIKSAKHHNNVTGFFMQKYSRTDVGTIFKKYQVLLFSNN